ncbi:hypothetical protein SprV_0200860600 [Sparganum proliferum]
MTDVRVAQGGTSDRGRWGISSVITDGGDGGGHRRRRWRRGRRGKVNDKGLALHFIQKCRHEDGLVHLQFSVQLEAVAISHGDLQPAKDLAEFGDPLSNLVVDSRSMLVQPAAKRPIPLCKSSSPVPADRGGYRGVAAKQSLASRSWQLVDYVLVQRRDHQEVLVTKAIPDVDGWTNHRLVTSKMKIRL